MATDLTTYTDDQLIDTLGNTSIPDDRERAIKDELRRRLAPPPAGDCFEGREHHTIEWRGTLPGDGHGFTCLRCGRDFRWPAAPPPAGALHPLALAYLQAEKALLYGKFASAPNLSWLGRRASAARDAWFAADSSDPCPIHVAVSCDAMRAGFPCVLRPGHKRPHTDEQGDSWDCECHDSTVSPAAPPTLSAEERKAADRLAAVAREYNTACEWTDLGFALAAYDKAVAARAPVTPTPEPWSYEKGPPPGVTPDMLVGALQDAVPTVPRADGRKARAAVASRAPEPVCGVEWLDDWTTRRCALRAGHKGDHRTLDGLHGTRAEAPEPATVEPAYTCPRCREGFSTADDFAVHDDAVHGHNFDRDGATYKTPARPPAVTRTIRDRVDALTTEIRAEYAEVAGDDSEEAMPEDYIRTKLEALITVLDEDEAHRDADRREKP